MIRAIQGISLFFTFLIAYIIWVILGAANASDITQCVTTKQNKIYLCDKSADYVRLDQISPFLKNLIIIAEDASFYSHSGFDEAELKNSLSTNFDRKKMARGGSTITQQLAKNVFLSFDKSITRKMREALLTMQIEKILTKNLILEKYLNVIEFGPAIYGIKKAAEHYFQKTPAELNLLESAYLVYLVPNPKLHSKSFASSKLSSYGRFRILDLSYRMYRFGRISYQQYLEAKSLVDDFPWRNLSENQINTFDNALMRDGEPTILEDVEQEDDSAEEPFEP